MDLFLYIKYVEILTVFADTFNDKRNKCRRIVFIEINFFIMQNLMTYQIKICYVIKEK